MNILKVKNYKDVNLNDSKESLDYLIYLTEDYSRLIELTITFDKEKTTLDKFIRQYDKIDYQYSLTTHYSSSFYDTFVKKDSFIFDSYFFNNSSSDLEKTAKINRLTINVLKIIAEFEKDLQRKNFTNNYYDYHLELSEKYKNEIPNIFILNGVKYKYHPYKLLKYHFGIELYKIYNKIVTNYTGFFKESSIKKISSVTNLINSINDNPFPIIFKSNLVYKNFINYTSKHIIEPYRDYSYLFQRLKNEGLIYDMKHKKFIDWLLSEDFIKEKDYNDFIDSGGFRSYSKSYHVERENNFNNIFQ
jgi:hypothetical protein